MIEPPILTIFSRTTVERNPDQRRSSVRSIFWKYVYISYQVVQKKVNISATAPVTSSASKSALFEHSLYLNGCRISQSR